MRRSSEAHGVARRANTILLLDDGQNYAQIAASLYLDDDTIRGWHKHYLSGGWDALKDFSWKGGISRLSHAQEQDLCTWLENRFCRDTKEIRHYMARTHFVQYSHAGCIKLLHRLGFVYKKPQKLPRTANEAEQQDFIDFYQDLQRCLPEDEAIYFADAVHPEYQSRPAHGWVRRGAKTALKTTSGRKRVNIHGALCLENFDAPFVEVERVNAHSAIALLEKLETANPGKKTIHVIWDNASYHKAEAVKSWLRRANCRIHLVRLPTYAPHLNPIERLWGVMHQYVTHNKFYETQGLFAAAVLEFLRETIPKKWKTFRDTVTDNFRIISHQNFRILE
jgi:transposase